MPRAVPAAARPVVSLPTLGLLLLLAAVGGLITYKAGAALRTLAAVQASGTLSAKSEWIPIAGTTPWLRPFAGAANNFAWIAIALSYGIVIGAVVKALLPQRWLVRVLGDGAAAPLVGAAAVGVSAFLVTAVGALALG